MTEQEPLRDQFLDKEEKPKRSIGEMSPEELRSELAYAQSQLRLSPKSSFWMTRIIEIKGKILDLEGKEKGPDKLNQA
jgi:hypothetical protein